MKQLKFETIYNRARQLVKGRIAGPYLKDQKNVDIESYNFRRGVFLTFSTEASINLKKDFISVWVFDQNEVQTTHTGRKTLKALCLSRWYLLVGGGYKGGYKMVYIQRKDNHGLKTIDRLETRREAIAMLWRYTLSDPGPYYYLSQRPCKDWIE